jgi:alcohol dehydrogenase class IV
VALVDPTLTYGCPPKVTASSGIDALVHAIEAYTCKKAQSFSDALALEAMRLIIGSLRTAVKDGSNREARNHMSEGALLAGMSFGNASTAVVHAVSQALGSRYHTPHGTANGLFLPYVLEYNLSADLPRHATVAKMLRVKTEGLSLQEAAEKGVEAAKALATDIGIPLHLRELGVPEDALDEMAVVSMDAKRLFDNNARQLTLDDVKQIWRNAW